MLARNAMRTSVYLASSIFRSYKQQRWDHRSWHTRLITYLGCVSRSAGQTHFNSKAAGPRVRAARQGAAGCGCRGEGCRGRGRGILVLPGVGAFSRLHRGTEGAGRALAQLSEEAPEGGGGASETPPHPAGAGAPRSGCARPLSLSLTRVAWRIARVRGRADFLCHHPRGHRPAANCKSPQVAS